MTHDLPQMSDGAPGRVNPHKAVRKKRRAAGHVHKWRKSPAGRVSWGCTNEGFPSCHSTAVVTCACGHGRCAKHAPRPRKAKPFRRWSLRNGLLAFDGYIFDDEDKWWLAARAIVATLNHARLVPKVRP
jgi:hypothetical protein